MRRAICRSGISTQSTAVHRVAKDATDWDARDARWSMVVAGIDADPATAVALTTWGRNYWKSVHPFNLGGAYVNFMMDDKVQGGSERNADPKRADDLIHSLGHGGRST